MTKNGQKGPKERRKVPKKGRFLPFFSTFLDFFSGKPKKWVPVGSDVQITHLGDALALCTVTQAWGGAGRTKYIFFSLCLNLTIYGLKLVKIWTISP